MRIFFSTLLSVTLLFIFGCDEELPPQNNPLSLFTSTASTQYQYLPETKPSQSSIDIYIVYKNLYDETLQDVASMKGTITIEWDAPPEERGGFNPLRTDELTFDNLFYAKNYNFGSNTIIIDPKDSIIVRYRWNLKTDDSTSLINHVKYLADNNCFVTLTPGGFPGHRLISVKQQFKVSAKFSIFQRGGTILTLPANFSSCWIFPHYGESVTGCDPPNPYNPCTSLGQP